METLGDRIKLLRNKRTQEELAAVLQVDRSTVASWEVNRREPDIATLCRIATFFKVSIDWLTGHTANKADKPAKLRLWQEDANGYLPDDDEEWQKLIATARQYGFTPDMVYQLLELNAKLAFSLKNNSK